MNILVIFFVFLSFFSVQCDENIQKLKLITVLYNETDPQRIQEYIDCLERNLSHASIDHIHILYDIVRDDQKNILHEYLQSKNVTISYITGRPSFVYCFNLANEMFPNDKVILSNADIYFNDTLRFLERYNLKGKFLAITRKEVSADGKVSYMRNSGAYIGRKEGSQDVWVFQTLISLFKRDDIKLGTLHCEGEVAYQMMQLGYKVINPFFTIDCFHWHLSGIRHYADRPIPWPYFIELPLSELI